MPSPLISILPPRANMEQASGNGKTESASHVERFNGAIAGMRSDYSGWPPQADNTPVQSRHATITSANNPPNEPFFRKGSLEITPEKSTRYRVSCDDELSDAVAVYFSMTWDDAGAICLQNSERYTQSTEEIPEETMSVMLQQIQDYLILSFDLMLRSDKRRYSFIRILFVQLLILLKSNERIRMAAEEPVQREQIDFKIVVDIVIPRGNRALTVMQAKRENLGEAVTQELTTLGIVRTAPRRPSSSGSLSVSPRRERSRLMKARST
ncbi:hypothetical protein FI667_g6092, partial [Globisporangium splendens]